MNQNNQQPLKVLIGLVILAGLAATIIVLSSDDFNPWSSKTLAIALSLLFYGITGTVCWAVTRKKEHNILGYAGLAVAGVGFLLNTAGILGEFKSTEMLKLTFNLWIASIGLAHISFLFYITVQNRYASIARTVATIFIAIFSLLIISKVFGIDEEFFFLTENYTTYLRLILAAWVLDLTATLLVPLCNQLQVQRPAELEFSPTVAELPTPTDDAHQPAT